MISYPGTQINTSIPITYDGMQLAFTREPGGYRVSVTPYAPGSTTALFNVPLDQDINSVTFQVADDAIGPTNSTETLYFNNIQITPEPTGAGLLAVAACVMLRRRACSAT